MIARVTTQGVQSFGGSLYVLDCGGSAYSHVVSAVSAVAIALQPFVCGAYD